MELNKIYCESNLDTMKRMPDDFIDLTVTSPPYDNLRTYNGYSFDFESVAKELFRVTKPGGVVVWNVNDMVVNGSETLTSCKQKIFFNEQCGFNMHDTMIYKKLNFSNPEKTRYQQLFEYVFILSKGKPKTFNPIFDKPNKTAGKMGWGKNTYTDKDGSKSERNKKVAAEFGMRGNVWEGKTRGQEEGAVKLNHPAMMPKWLVKDNIISWSNVGDLVYDPFVGSGTTAVESIKLNRNWIGSEISDQYVAIANGVVSDCLNQ